MVGYIHDPLQIINLIADNLRDRYKSGFPVLKEIFQNADDAGSADESIQLEFGLSSGISHAEHPLLKGPALYFLNNGAFADLDDKAIRSFGLNRKSGELPQKKAANVEKRFSRELNRICKSPLAFKPAESLRKYLVGPERQHLFTFLRYPGVPPTNNHAEQSIRRLVIFGKISFGTRSQSGLMTHSVLPSLVLQNGKALIL